MEKTSLTEKIRGLTAVRIPDRAFLLCALAAAGAGAAALNGRYYVGYFNDDASFVLLARALWRALVSLSPSGLGGAFSHYLPGYPLFLAPFAAAADPSWHLLRWTTAGLALLSVYGFWLLLGGWLREGERRWAVGLYAVHPLFLYCSGMVMADPFLACLFTWGLLGLRRVLEGGAAPAFALLLGASAWAAAVKPIGALLPLAVTAALAAARARRALRLFALLFWLPCLALLLYVVLHRQGPTDYVTYMLQGLASLAEQPPLARAYALLHSLVLVCGLGWFWPRGPLWDPAGAALIAGVLYLSARGLVSLLAQGQGRHTALAAGALLLGQGLVLSLWTAYSERYALPLLPLGLLFLTVGAGAAWPARPLAARALLAALAASFLLHSAKLALEGPEARLCAETLDWIRRQTPADSRFTGNAPLLFLYTGRRGDGLFQARDADQFLFSLSNAGITHVMLTDQAILSARGSLRNDHALQKRLELAWVAGHPRHFRKLYANPAERTAVYAVLAAPGRSEAARHYARALREFGSSDLAGAESSLRLALAADRDFPSALAALASVILARGGEPAEAERLLRRALELEPNFPRASGALAQLLEDRGRPAEAVKAREAALAALARPPFEVQAK